MNRLLLEIAAVVGSSAYVGVMVVIGLGLGGYWLGVEPTAYAAQFEVVFLTLVPCIALTLLPGLTGVSVRLAQSWNTPEAKRRWGFAMAALVLSLVITVGYHVPANFRIWSGELDSAALTSELYWWLGFHLARVLAALLGACAAFWATQAD